METVTVIGKVLVDGKPPVLPKILRITAHPEESHLVTGHYPPSGHAQEDGSFELSTYETGDGVPAGTYRLTFDYGELKVQSGAPLGFEKDLLGGKYSNPKESEITVTVKGDETESIDLGTIELSTGS